ncbi:hypothetical protein VTL71DRAFT_3875 [Oculimacula yallundae]|uniref:Thioesterase-like superfamily-domain-containing protein n=1 Tax=Oculimacula yallundae TaxID=86028 RepID=A0ABR4C4Y4_9HELO
MSTPTSTSDQEVSFTDAMIVKALSSHTYEAHFPEDWCIGSVPHGGYITSVFQRVANTHFNTTLKAQNQPHTIALHLDFLRRTEKGPALFTVKDTKLGRQTSVIHLTLTQSSREEVHCTLTQSNMSLESGISIPTNYTLRPPPPPAPTSFPLLSQNRDPNWANAGEMPHAEFRKATRKTEFYLPRPALQEEKKGGGGQEVEREKEKGYTDQWMRLKSGEKWTDEMLGYVVDMFMMPVEKYIRLSLLAPSPSSTASTSPAKSKPTAKFWYPTVLLNLDIKKPLPSGGAEWLFTRTSAKVVKNGRMDLEVVVLDQGGEVVALSHHVALAVPAERNLGVRGGGGKESKM